MWVAHFFSKKFQHICVSLDLNFNESLTNDVVSFEQLGPGLNCRVVLISSGLNNTDYFKMSLLNFLPCLHSVNVLMMLPLKAPIKIIADDSLVYLILFFQRKWDLTFHMNQLLGESHEMSSYFLWKIIIKKYFKISAAVMIGALRVNIVNVFTLVQWRHHWQCKCACNITDDCVDLDLYEVSHLDLHCLQAKIQWESNTLQ